MTQLDRLLASCDRVAERDRLLREGAWLLRRAEMTGALEVLDGHVLIGGAHVIACGDGWKTRDAQIASALALLIRAARLTEESVDPWRDNALDDARDIAAEMREEARRWD